MKLLTGLLMLIILPLVLQAQESQQKTFTKGDHQVKESFTATISTKIVRNAPFSAEAISESVQILADGNKFTQYETTKIYRDSQGRVRREQIPNAGANTGFVNEIEQTISIFDPVAGVRFLLNTKAKTARQSEAQTIYSGEKSKVSSQSINETKKETGSTSVRKQYIIRANPKFSPETSKNESLGVQEIEGVKAVGTRSTTTVPAGTIGNERAFDIVYERWFSEELQQIILSKHTDPRFGVQTYRLTNIRRNEPDRSLFTPPAGYTIKNSKVSTYQINRTL